MQPKYKKYFITVLVLISITLIATQSPMKNLLKINMSHKENNKYNPILNENVVFINQDGQSVVKKDFIDHHSMIFFGFSHCKTICPNVIAAAKDAIANLKNKEIKFYFVSLDPKRDTIERLKQFAAEMFDNDYKHTKRFQMLRSDQIEQIRKDFKVYVDNTTEDDQINHSSLIYLLDKKANFIGILRSDSSNNILDDLLKENIN